MASSIEFPSTVSTDEKTEDQSSRRERYSSRLGLVLSCSATGDTTYYGSSFVHNWLLMFTEGKMKITFDTIFPALKKGLIHEGQIDKDKLREIDKDKLREIDKDKLRKIDKLREIEELLTNVEKKTRGKSSKKRIKELQKCCAKLYTEPCFIFRVLNTALRDNDQSKLESLGPLAYLLFNFIDRRFKDNSLIRDSFRRIVRPNEIKSMILYRGECNSNNIIEEYRSAAGDKSKNFKWLSFVSTSLDRNIAEGFAFPDDILYIIEIQSYLSNEDRFTDLSEISQFPKEKEILLLPGVQFQVNEVSFDEEKKLHLVYIKINSSYISKLK
jgi:hypothetical protein